MLLSASHLKARKRQCENDKQRQREDAERVCVSSQDAGDPAKFLVTSDERALQAHDAVCKADGVISVDKYAKRTPRFNYDAPLGVLLLRLPQFLVQSYTTKERRLKISAQRFKFEFDE